MSLSLVIEALFERNFCSDTLRAPRNRPGERRRLRLFLSFMPDLSVFSVIAGYRYRCDGGSKRGLVARGTEFLPRGVANRRTSASPEQHDDVDRAVLDRCRPEPFLDNYTLHARRRGLLA